MKKADWYRKLSGGIFCLVAAINLFADFAWLNSRTVHRLHPHLAGLPVISFLLALMIALALFGLYLLVTPEPKTVMQNKQALTPPEKDSLRRWYKKNRINFAITMVLLVAGALSCSFSGNLLYYTPCFLMAAYSIYILLSGRCPNCGFRLAYNSHLVSPLQCPVCGIGFK